jgi:hypothetical protein
MVILVMVPTYTQVFRTLVAIHLFAQELQPPVIYYILLSYVLLCMIIRDMYVSLNGQNFFLFQMKFIFFLFFLIAHLNIYTIQMYANFFNYLRLASFLDFYRMPFSTSVRGLHSQVIR